MTKQYDILIVGAGPVGCVVAERLAKTKGWSCLIIDKRDHIAGNCYDRVHESGVLIHQYGPHYFRSNKKELIDYLGQYTDWIPGNYEVKSYFNGELYPFPINLLTLGQFFNREFTAEEAEAFLNEIRDENADPRNSEEFVLSRVGKELYEAFYLNYTLKQWETHPKDLNKSVCGRIPVRFNKDIRYVDHEYQLTPKAGFTQMFHNMIDHPLIEVQLNTDFNDVRNEIKPRIATLYSGPVDAYFNFELGKLPWRSLDISFKEFKEEYKQPCVQINYPNDHEYTRSVEIKHVTAQKSDNTVISYEVPTWDGDPYYPVPADENAALYAKYKALADKENAENKVYFAGRLARYLYINTDEAIEMALETAQQIMKDAAK
ncbi:MAG: UDP-galactopyranose mutase [Flavobacteriales bacterium]|nr:UDP-galactopyranose mutase [Flavobacteriales bacterium]